MIFDENSLNGKWLLLHLFVYLDNHYNFVSFASVLYYNICFLVVTIENISKKIGGIPAAFGSLTLLSKLTVSNNFLEGKYFW